MISYSPFWETLKKKNLTVYYLTVKKGVNSNTINCIKKGKSVTLYTINNLCTILDCRIEDIVEYIPDPVPPPDIMPISNAPPASDCLLHSDAVTSSVSDKI